MAPVLWSGLAPNPKNHEVTAGYERYREAGADVVLGIVGASVIEASVIDRRLLSTMRDACLTTNPRQATEPEIDALFRAALPRWQRIPRAGHRSGSRGLRVLEQLTGIRPGKRSF